MKQYFLEIYPCPKPVVGMLHLGDLDACSDHEVESQAMKDIQALHGGGIDGILIENWHEKGNSPFVTTHMAKRLLRIIQDISPHITIPFGINILNNDYKTALSIAKKVEADFVQLDVLVDHVRSNFTHNAYAKTHPFEISVDINDVWSAARAAHASDIPLIVFVQPKQYRLLEPNKSIEQSVQEAVGAGASALIITKSTGIAPMRSVIERAKLCAGTIPVGIGSGLSIANAHQYMPFVDFAIVGTSLKVDGKTDNPVDIHRVRQLMKIARSMRLE